MNRNELYKNIANGLITQGLVKPKANEKVCNKHLEDFLNFVHYKTKGLTKTIKNYLASYGYPKEFLHTSCYLTCDECRGKNKDTRTKRSQNIERSRQLLQKLNDIYSAIDNGTFRRHGGSKLEIRWRELAGKYARQIDLPSDTPFMEKMRVYSQYRVQRVDDNFYGSSKWVNLRTLIISAYGCTCMKCKRPGLVGSELHCDHILPRSLFPEHELDADNMQILCRSCNSSKSNRRLVDYRPSDWCSILEKVLVEK